MEIGKLYEFVKLNSDNIIKKWVDHNTNQRQNQ